MNDLYIIIRSTLFSFLFFSFLILCRRFPVSQIYYKLFIYIGVFISINNTTATSILFYRFGRCNRVLLIPLILFCLFSFAYYQEFFCHRLARRSWIHLEPSEKDSRYLRLLIVADPQLIGYQNDLPGIGGSIARYDADTYLSRSYAQAFGHHKPDMILFLGDLFDEGNTATNEEFLATVKRFRHIFPSPNTLVVHIPGDNDVGGEGMDRYSNTAQQRFLRYFDTSRSQMNFIGFRFLRFSQTSVMSGEYRPIGMVSPNATDVLSIVASHFPLLDTMDFTAERILQVIRPDLILSAHDHTARILSRRNILHRGPMSITPIKPSSDLLFSKRFLNKKLNGIQISDDEYPAYEIVSPTCSYRMGVRHMGYGAMIIEQFMDKTIGVKYTVLWTPDRYKQLYIYLAILLIIMACTIASVIWMNCYRKIYRFCTSTRFMNKRFDNSLDFTY